MNGTPDPALIARDSRGRDCGHAARANEVDDHQQRRAVVRDRLQRRGDEPVEGRTRRALAERGELRGSWFRRSSRRSANACPARWSAFMLPGGPDSALLSAATSSCGASVVSSSKRQAWHRTASGRVRDVRGEHSLPLPASPTIVSKRRVAGQPARDVLVEPGTRFEPGVGSCGTAAAASRTRAPGVTDVDRQPTSRLWSAGAEFGTAPVRRLSGRDHGRAERGPGAGTWSGPGRRDARERGGARSPPISPRLRRW